ncbi:MAG: hypothetical protein Q8T13_13700 [Acidobacteriota bacterium]|nr:hypothetical protein [Acidobacteriota bacterium]
MTEAAEETKTEETTQQPADAGAQDPPTGDQGGAAPAGDAGDQGTGDAAEK